MSERSLQLSRVNAYLAHKQHLLPRSKSVDTADGLLQILGDMVALHGTVATGPYLSLWARMPAFQRQALDTLLYDQRSMVRLLCMRSTLHLVPSHRMPYFYQAYAGRQVPAARRRAEALLVQAGLCEAGRAGQLLEELQGQVLAVLDDQGACTVSALSEAVPELQAQVRHDVGKSYEGAFSVGSRLVPALCDMGLLVRARPRGTWRSNLYEYAALADWLPDVDLASLSPSEARTWLVRRYLSTFGPATFEDIQWWTGFSKGETDASLRSLQPGPVEVSIASLEPGQLMMDDDARRLSGFAPTDSPYAFLLPGLDPYIMGYRSRERFLAPEHLRHVFDRTGNAMPTVWIDGRVAGAWGQHKDGGVVVRFFASPGEKEAALVSGRAQRLEAFLDGELLPQRSHTDFTRAIIRQTSIKT